MSFGYTEKQLDALMAMECAEDVADYQLAVAALTKLTVPELRVLYRHYFPTDDLSWMNSLKKGELIETVVEKYQDDPKRPL